MSLHTIFFFFFNDTATTEIYTLSLHDALPIWFTSTPSRLPHSTPPSAETMPVMAQATTGIVSALGGVLWRSEEHTSELQSRSDLVCRLLLEKKKQVRTQLTLENCILTDMRHPL